MKRYVWIILGLFLLVLSGCAQLSETETDTLDTQAAVNIVATTASNTDGSNVPANVLDGSLDTRWSAEGEGQWIRFELAPNTDVSSIAIAYYLGDQRKSEFNVQTSDDGTTWTHARIDGQAIVSSSGTTTGLETYDFPDTTARYVRIVGYGNTNSDWNSITEVQISNGGTTTPPPPTSGDDIYVSPSGSDSNSGSSASPVKTVTKALSLRKAGGKILLRAGDYGRLELNGVSGSSSNPIVISAAPGAEQKARFSTGALFANQTYAIWLKNCAYITLQGLKIDTSQKAITVDASNNITLRDNLIENIGDEGIAIRKSSSDSRVVGNTVRGTGKRTPKNGEGIYVGTGSGLNDPDFVPTDLTNNILISGNDVSNTGSEAIDIKNPTTNITIERNRIHDLATATSGAVVLHYNNKNPSGDAGLIFRNNRVWNITRNSISDGDDGIGLVIGASAQVYNNLFYNMEHQAILIERSFKSGASLDVAITHNTIWDTGKVGIGLYQTSPAEVRVTNNLASLEIIQEGSELPRGPGFTSSGNLAPTANDFTSLNPLSGFRLASGSRAVDAGVSSGLKTDLEGNPRPRGSANDVGAFERQ